MADSVTGTEVARPPCFNCGESYTSVTMAWHTEPLSCVCPRCQGMPGCYTCRNMYCACDVHQHG